FFPTRRSSDLYQFLLYSWYFKIEPAEYDFRTFDSLESELYTGVSSRAIPFIASAEARCEILLLSFCVVVSDSGSDSIPFSSEEFEFSSSPSFALLSFSSELLLLVSSSSFSSELLLVSSSSLDELLSCSLSSSSVLRYVLSTYPSMLLSFSSSSSNRMSEKSSPD